MKSRPAEVFNDINITPLTDIFLVLLIIMMVVAPLLEYRQIDLAVGISNASEDEPTQEPEEPKTVHLVIAADGSYTIDGEGVLALGLVDGIRERAVDKPEGLIIETHPDAVFQAMARAMDAAQMAGVIHVTTAETQLAPPEPEPAPKPAAKPAAKSSSKGKKKK